MTFRQLIRFTNDAAGLEKILRLLQSLSQIIAAYAFTVDDAVVWMHLRRQFSLGRRYFRFFRFLNCFTKAYEAFLILTPITFLGLLVVAKWSFMGSFMFLESCTILDAIGVWPTSYAEVIMIEANRFWFYSLLTSLLEAGVRYWETWLEKEKLNGGGKALKEGIQKPKVEDSKVQEGIKRRVVADCFDLLIPGHAVGWIPSSLAIVGFASVISTLLSSRDIWDRLRCL